MTTIYRKPTRTQKMLYARVLRKRMTEAEKFLWERLRARKCCGLKFRRQAPIGSYIVDFVCLERSLVIEIDGEIHALREDYDQDREKKIRNRGFRILRFTNQVVLEKLDIVVSIIEETAKQNRALSPSPGRRAARKERGLGGEAS